MKNTKNRSAFGEVIMNHKGKKISTSVGSLQYESMFSVPALPTNATIPAGYEHRPELISNLFMKSSSNWWVFCERNAIFDIFEQLNSGDSIRLPLTL